ncbi:hypothetical protein ElP_67500 [Tautonia plasticadhaerens]|uniref:Uncharacterized protein n=1 Tax=Tautonia plasticadhaerens TaxID=2527974 RepID=A0A518HD91_9BACT|nr:hypothetical protein ElP_67500 [Tautonia plasticadhaerens]
MDRAASGCGLTPSGLTRDCVGPWSLRREAGVERRVPRWRAPRDRPASRAIRVQSAGIGAGARLINSSADSTRMVPVFSPRETRET